VDLSRSYSKIKMWSFLKHTVHLLCELTRWLIVAICYLIYIIWFCLTDINTRTISVFFVVSMLIRIGDDDTTFELFYRISHLWYLASYRVDLCALIARYINVSVVLSRVTNCKKNPWSTRIAPARELNDGLAAPLGRKYGGKFSAPFVVVVVVGVLFIYEMRRAPDGRLQLYGEISSVSYELMRCFIESGGARSPSTATQWPYSRRLYWP